MSRVFRYGLLIVGSALVGVGIWFRVTSPTSMPLIDADEAFFGIQANRVLNGKTPAFETYTGNVVSPLNAGLQIPLIAAFGPRWWILRVPTITAGLLAILFTASMFRRPLDRPTSLIAAFLLACWPLAILSSRIGYDANLTPLLSVFVLGFAFQGRGIAMTLAWVAALSAHPTNLFLLPIAMPVFLLRAWSMTEGNAPRRYREISFGALIPGLIAIAIGVMKLRTAKYLALQDRPLPGLSTFGAWGYLSRLGQILLGVWIGEPTDANALMIKIATISMVLLLCAGAIRLAWRKCWDRLAIILAVAATLAGFRLVGGSNCLMSPRYALFGVVPLAVSLACSISAFAIAPITRIRWFGRGIQLVSVGGFGAVLLAFTWINGIRPFVVMRLDEPWTLRVEREDSFVTASTILLRDSTAAPIGRPVPVYAESEWVGWPLMYLTASDPRLAFSSEWAWNYDTTMIRGLINQSLYSGGYAIGKGDGPVAALVESMHPLVALRRWDFELGAERRLVIYRFNRPGEAPALPVVVRVPPIGDETVRR